MRPLTVPTPVAELPRWCRPVEWVTVDDVIAAGACSVARKYQLEAPLSWTAYPPRLLLSILAQQGKPYSVRFVVELSARAAGPIAPNPIYQQTGPIDSDLTGGFFAYESGHGFGDAYGDAWVGGAFGIRAEGFLGDQKCLAGASAMLYGVGSGEGFGSVFYDPQK